MKPRRTTFARCVLAVASMIVLLTIAAAITGHYTTVEYATSRWHIALRFDRLRLAFASTPVKPDMLRGFTEGVGLPGQDNGLQAESRWWPSLMSTSGPRFRTASGAPKGPQLAVIYIPMNLIIAAAVLLLIALLLVLRPRYPQGHCAKCGYDLTGLPKPICPECGSSTLRTLWQRIRSLGRLRQRPGCAVASLSA